MLRQFIKVRATIKACLLCVDLREPGISFNTHDLLNSVNAILLCHGVIRLSNEELLKIIRYGHEQLCFDSNASAILFKVLLWSVKAIVKFKAERRE